MSKMSDATESRTIGKVTPKQCRVVTRKLTKEEARTVFPYRPYRNGGESLYGGDDLYDDVCLLLNDLAKRCTTCRAAVRDKVFRQPAMRGVTNGQCPDCSGVAEHVGLITRDGRLP